MEKRLAKLEHHVELLEQAIKVKPVNIKREIVRETFDHRLVLLNIILLFLNIILLTR